MARSSFGVTRQHKMSGGKWTFCQCVIRSHTNFGRQFKEAFHHTHTTINCTTCSMNAPPNIRTTSLTSTSLCNEILNLANEIPSYVNEIVTRMTEIKILSGLHMFEI